MTSRDLVVSVEEGDATRFDSMSEGYVYLYMRHHADKKGVLRLAMTELAGMLGVNRQTILKHVDTLMAKRLVDREGHGRYRVFDAPRTIRDHAADYFASLKVGEEYDSGELYSRVYGRKADYNANDPDLDQVMDVAVELEQAGFLATDPNSFTMTKLREAVGRKRRP